MLAWALKTHANSKKYAKCCLKPTHIATNAGRALKTHANSNQYAKFCLKPTHIATNAVAGS